MSHAAAASGTRPPPHPIDRPTAHIGALDSIRGIAAATVLVHHVGLAYASIHGIDVAAAGLFWRVVDHVGHSAVIVFFVLSGFVLQTSYERTTDFAYLPYLAKRIARIYPALVVAILGSAVLNAVVAPVRMPAMGDWLNSFADARHDPYTILTHLLLLVRGPEEFALDTPIWSLAYEMRFSLVFPALAWVAMRRSRWFPPLIVLLYLAASGWLAWRHEHGPYILGYGRARTLAISVMYLICFGIGMAAVRGLRRRPALSPAVEGGLVVAALLILGLVRDEVACGVAALALIAAAVAPGSLTARLAGQAWALWLGRISYSLYLMHVIALYYLFYLLTPAVPFAALAPLAIGVALGLGHLSYRWIERPGMRAGRVLAGRLA